MSDLFIKTLADTQSPLLISIVAVVLAVFVLREYANILIKLRGSRASSQTALNEPAPPHSFDDPKQVVDFNFRLLEKYYDQTLAEYRLNSRTTIVVACLGFAVILIGVAFTLAGITTIGVLSSVAGLIAEAATVLFYKQNQSQIRQVEEYHKKLVSTQYLLTAISLTGDIDGEAREKEIKRIILKSAVSIQFSTRCTIAALA